MTRRAVALGGAGLLATVSTLPANALESPLIDPVEAADEFWLAVEAYIYGYPLVTTEMTRRVVTNVAQPEGSKGPMGHIIKLREYPNASFKDVTAPNADTLYTTALSTWARSPGYCRSRT